MVGTAPNPWPAANCGLRARAFPRLAGLGPKGRRPAHARVRSLDNNGNHPEAVASVLGTGQGDAGASFARLSGDLTSAITSDQAVFNSTARSATTAYTALEPGVIVAALLMAAACAWGLGRRLAEYH